MSQTFLYTLSDPRDGAIRYVGITSQPEYREKRHRKSFTDDHRGHWVAQLHRENLAPIFQVRTTFKDPAFAADTERRLIGLLRASGYRLVNGTDGGDGYPGATKNVEVRAKISKTLKGRKLPAETRAAISKGLRGNTNTSGHTLSPEHRAKVGVPGNQNAKGTVHTDEYKEQKRQQMKGNQHLLGHRHSLESKAKMRAAKQARRTREQIANGNS